MDMGAASPEICHGPLDCAPVIGHQNVGIQLVEGAAEGQHVADGVAFGKGGLEDFARRIGIKKLHAFVLAIHGEQPVLEIAKAVIDQRSKADLRPTDAQGGEYMQKCARQR